MSSGFMVDLTVLVNAAKGVNGTIAAVPNDKVSGGSQASCGRDTLGSSLSGFCSRWQTGVQNLATGASQVVAAKW